MSFTCITILAYKLFLRNEAHAKVLNTDKEKLQSKKFKPRKYIIKENGENMKIIKLPTFNNIPNKESTI